MSDPYFRWMLFVDGENFTIRGQKLAEHFGFQLLEGPMHSRDAFVWPKHIAPSKFLWASELTVSGGYMPVSSRPSATRCYYFTGVKGDDAKLNEVRGALRTLGFDPQVFKKDKPSQPTKAVDVSMATEILSLSHQNAFDVACLIAGDRDREKALPQLFPWDSGSRSK